MTEIRLIHVADIHLGYTGNKNLVFGENDQNPGRYIREVDLEQSVQWLTKCLVQADPPVDIVVFAGDLFHSTVPAPRAVTTAARMIKRIVRKGIDIVIVDGNHDVPKVIHTGSPATFLEEFGEGVHIVNGTTYEVIQGNQWLNKRLRGQLAVHCLPYQQVYKGDFTGATPHSGCLNVLLAHGRVGGMPDLNTLGLPAGRIPLEVLRRGWDYIALGDWHIHRYQPLKDVPAYYAGSLEALNFSEAEKYPHDPGDQNVARGAIDVRLGENGQRTINTLPNDGRRRLLRLKVIDAAKMDAEALMKKLRQRLKNDFPPGALVRLEINNCPKAIWGQLDHEELEELQKQAGLSCHIRPNFIHSEAEQSSQAASSATLEEQWQQFLSNMVSDEGERQWLLQAGTERVEAARQELNRQRSVQDEQLMEIDHD